MAEVAVVRAPAAAGLQANGTFLQTSAAMTANGLSGELYQTVKAARVNRRPHGHPAGLSFGASGKATRS